jgi:Zn-dependent M28 family amino/carboxypeptidase
MKTVSILALVALASPAFANDSQANQKKSLVSSKALQKLIKLDDLLDGSKQLQKFADKNGGNRAFGSGGHNATVDYLYKALKKLDYNVVKQPFVELFTAATVDFSAGGQNYKAEYMTYGPSGDISGVPLVSVNNLGCDAADYPSTVSGKVALVRRGTCSFAIKALNAKAAGAVGTIIYNNVPGSLQGTLGGEGDYAPTVGIQDVVGAELLAKIGNGTALTINLHVDTIRENRTSYNVIAETKGGDHNNVLMLGGHTDSVFAGPGINDDGSGTIGVLTVAKALSKFSVKNAVRFAFWSAEEYGLLGSYHYMKTLNGTISGGPKEVSKVRAYLNFDMIASPNYVLGIYDGDGSAFNLTGPKGSDTIEKDFETFFKSNKANSVPSIFSGRSDYAAFLQNGIPSGGLFTGAEELKTEKEAQLFGGQAGVALDANYHQAGDTYDNLNHEAYLLNSQAIAYSVAKYAVSWDGIPKADMKIRARSADLHRYFGRFEYKHSHMHSQPCGHAAEVI